MFVPYGRPTGLGDIVVASYNVHKCVGVDGCFDPTRITAVIKELNADVLALQEVDQRFGDRTGLLDFSRIERETGLVAVPIKPLRGSHGWHGNIVLIRNALALSAHQLVLPGVEPRGALVVDISLPAGHLRLIAAHLGLLRRSRARQIRAILSASVAEDGRPTILVGDLNEWRLGPRSALKGLEPAFGPLHADVASFPSRFPVWSLDRILASPQRLISRIAVHDTPLAREASDHLPIKASIALGAEAASVQEVASAA
ncbi:endonuclease/exonuclease/phosphatase family protein [soil metagenome]